MKKFLQGLFKSKNEVQRYKIKEYPETPTEYSVSNYGKIPIFFGEELLRNPDRGFRGELYITLGKYLAYPGNE